MGGRPTKDEMRAIARRRDDALTLRLAGVDNVTIGRKLAADPSINSDRLAYPCGYGSERYANGDDPPDDEALAGAVREDLSRAYRYRRANIAENLEELRELQEARIERLLTTVWSKALSGDLDAVAPALKLLERQARLHGLDAPARTELTGKDGGPVELTPAQRAREAAIGHLAEVRQLSVANRAALEQAVTPDEEFDDVEDQ